LANIQHNALTDPKIHEPKGVATALANSVYVADGAGSGDWTEITENNINLIHTASDLPTASGGARTLAANTVYHIVGQVDIGSDRLILSNNTVIKGTNQDFDEITSTTTGALITQTDVNARLNQVKLTCASGTLFDIDGTGSQTTDWIRVNATCDTIGDIDNLGNIDMFRSSFFATSSGMTLTGAHGDFEIDDCSVSVTAVNGTCVDLGTATFNHVRLTNSEFGNPTGTGYGVDIAPAGANMNSTRIGFITACDFESRSNATNYVEGDDNWEITASLGVSPSTSKAQGSVNGNANANAFGGGVGVPEVVNFGTSFVSDIADKFTISTAGRFTYTGILATLVRVSVTSFVTMGGGAARFRNMYIAKNGTVVTSSIATQRLDGTNAATMVCNSLVSLATNDYVELFIEAETAVTATTVDTASIIVVEAQ